MIETICWYVKWFSSFLLIYGVVTKIVEESEKINTAIDDESGKRIEDQD